jgi:hypothetical protein
VLAARRPLIRVQNQTGSGPRARSTRVFEELTQ